MIVTSALVIHVAREQLYLSLHALLVCVFNVLFLVRIMQEAELYTDVVIHGCKGYSCTVNKIDIKHLPHLILI